MNMTSKHLIKNAKVKFERTFDLCLKIFTPDFNEWIKARRKTNYTSMKSYEN